MAATQTTSNRCPSDLIHRPARWIPNQTSLIALIAAVIAAVANEPILAEYDSDQPVVLVVGDSESSVATWQDEPVAASASDIDESPNSDAAPIAAPSAPSNKDRIDDPAEVPDPQVAPSSAAPSAAAPPIPRTDREPLVSPLPRKEKVDLGPGTLASAIDAGRYQTISTPDTSLWRATPVLKRVSDWPVERLANGFASRADGGLTADDADSGIVLLQFTDSGQPAPSPSLAAGNGATDTSSQAGLGWLGNVFASGLRSYLDVTPAATVLDPAALSTAFLEVRSDAGSLLENVPGANVGFRTPIYSDPILKGRRNPQAPARGSYWFPARQDLDTLLSKIDSRIVREFNTINGPYSVLYGPGLAFFDVRLLEAPRFNGLQNYGSTSADYKTNGDQFYGRQSVWGGDSTWGYRVGYGHRTGSDYESGDGTKFPSSYKSRMLDVILGGDLTADSRIDFSYLRLDQTDVEFPGQYFDLNFLVTDAYEVAYTVENQRHYDRLTVESWYNRTRFDGDNLRPGKRRLLPSLDALGVISTTDVDAMSTGYRLGVTWEHTLIGDLTAGSDLRYLSQSLNEFNSLLGSAPNNFPIPPAHSSNPGVFLQSDLAVTERLSLTAGTRVDWVSTNAQSFFDGQDYEQILRGEFDQHFDLWAAFLTGRYDLNCNWRLDGGFGHSMRPPTMTELYAAGPFIAAFPQKIFTTLWGNPHLSAERMWQVDLGLTAEYERFNAGLSGYYSWVNDYITFDFRTGAFVPQYGMVNTELATLTGFDMYADYDVSCGLKAFSTLSYVEGRDQTRDRGISQLRQVGTPRSNSLVPEEPLPVMPPLEGRVGVVVREPIRDPRWSVEIAARIVDAQDRVAVSLMEEPTAGYTVYDIRGYARLYDELMLIAGVENFTDKNYRTFYDTRAVSPQGQDLFQPGISYYFGGQLDY